MLQSVDVKPDITVWMPGLVRGKGRPRSRIMHKRDGSQFVHTYNPSETRHYEAELKFAAEQAMKKLGAGKLFDEALRVRITAMFAYPSSWSAKKRSNILHHATKPDGDNIMKCVGDAFNKVVWFDDSRVSEWIIRKYYDDTPGLLVEVWRTWEGLREL